MATVCNSPTWWISAAWQKSTWTELPSWATFDTMCIQLEGWKSLTVMSGCMFWHLVPNRISYQQWCLKGLFNCAAAKEHRNQRPGDGASSRVALPEVTWKKQSQSWLLTGKQRCNVERFTQHQAAPHTQVFEPCEGSCWWNRIYTMGKQCA